MIVDVRVVSLISEIVETGAVTVVVALMTSLAWEVIVGASGERFLRAASRARRALNAVLFSIRLRRVLSRGTSSARLSLAGAMRRPCGMGMMVGTMRHFGSCWLGRGGIVQVGTTVFVTLLWVLVQVLMVRVSHLVLVVITALGVTVIVLVDAGSVTVDLFGTVVVVWIVDVAGENWLVGGQLNRRNVCLLVIVVEGVVVCV